MWMLVSPEVRDSVSKHQQNFIYRLIIYSTGATYSTSSFIQLYGSEAW
jgi:hypothetical protein